MSRTNKKSSILAIVIIVIFGLAAVGFILNRTLISDYFRGLSFTPSAEMSKISQNLNLTERGQFIFNASWPSLENQENFNNFCVTRESNTAILGCFTEENIYVYYITEPELDGILEATTAHELLHAVFARLSDDEKSALKDDLNTVLSENSELLSSDLANYAEAEQFEELYVRAGTEIKDLPAALEAHYALIFQNQDQIVAYYDQYSSVFRELAADLAALETEISALKQTIDQKSQIYGTNLASLNAKIAEFNTCANTEGCFTSAADFNYQRQQLSSQQTSLSSESSEINALISEYNAKIDLYNGNILRGEKLNNAIDSTITPLEVDN